MRKRETNALRRRGGILLVLYILLLCYFLLFCSAFGRQSHEGYRYNLIPFREINRFYTYWKQVGFISAFLNMAGNIVGFIPFGILLPLVSVRMRRVIRTVLTGFGLSVILEFLQLVMKVGIFDVDDILLNTLGTLIGYILFLLLDSFRRKVLYG